MPNIRTHEMVGETGNMLVCEMGDIDSMNHIDWDEISAEISEEFDTYSNHESTLIESYLLNNPEIIQHV